MNGYTITPNLGEQVGIQWGGLTDRTETDNSSNGVPILIGYFKRGNPNKVIKVTEKTIRAVLGYEPENPHYQQAVLMLKKGVSPLSVVALGNLNSEPHDPD